MLKKPSGHLVPKALQSTQRSASTIVTNPVPKLSHAEKARNLLAKQKTGVLSTSTVDGAYPFGSIINFALDSSDGDAVFFFASSLAEHTSNLQRDDKASLFVSEEQRSSATGDQLALSRVTLVGHVTKVEKTAELVQAFKQRHAGAQYVLFEDFSAYKFTQIARVRYIAGFGEMSWITSEAFARARSDVIALNSAGAVRHMNEDHADANMAMVNAFARLPLPCTAATMLQVDKWGMDFLATTAEGKRLARVPFDDTTYPHGLTSVAEVKQAIVAMSKRAKL